MDKEAEPTDSGDRNGRESRDNGAHRAALQLIDALHAIGIEITSAREVVPQIGEPAVRVGILTVEDVRTICGLLRAEEARRRAAAIAERERGREE